MRRGILGLERKKHGPPPQFQAQFTILHVQARMETYTHTRTPTHKDAHAYMHLTEMYTTTMFAQ